MRDNLVILVLIVILLIILIMNFFRIRNTKGKVKYKDVDVFRIKGSITEVSSLACKENINIEAICYFEEKSKSEGFYVFNRPEDIENLYGHYLISIHKGIQFKMREIPCSLNQYILDENIDLKTVLFTETGEIVLVENPIIYD